MHGWQHICLQHGFLNLLIIWPTAQKKDAFQNITAHWQWQPVTQGLWWRWTMRIMLVFVPANTTSILQPMDQVIILIFKSYYWSNTFPKGITARNSDSSDGSGQSQSKTSWKVFTILDAIKNFVTHGQRSKYQH